MVNEHFLTICDPTNGLTGTSFIAHLKIFNTDTFKDFRLFTQRINLKTHNHTQTIQI